MSAKDKSIVKSGIQTGFTIGFKRHVSILDSGSVSRLPKIPPLKRRILNLYAMLKHHHNTYKPLALLLL